MPPIEDDGRIARALARCGTDAGSQLPGDECIDFVHCGNAEQCDLTAFNCCLAFGGVGDACTLDPCTTNDVIRDEARCDGPEDCPLGTRCCFQGGATACEAECAANGELCHDDSDCSTGSCAVGRVDVGFRFWVYWGFCEL